MSVPPAILSPREPLVDSSGMISRSWWRYFQAKDAVIGGTASPLTVTKSTILKGVTITNGGSIELAEIPGQTILGNDGAGEAEPSAITVSTSFFYQGGVLDLAYQPPGSLFGNPAGAYAAPTWIALGTGLQLDGVTLNVTSNADDERVLYGTRDNTGRVATLERRVAMLETVIASLRDGRSAAAAASRQASDALTMAYLTTRSDL